MSRQTFATIRNLSFETLWPSEVSQAMHTNLCLNLKLTKRTLTVNLLRKLIRNQVGTNEVMIQAGNITRHYARRNGFAKTVKFMMKEKLLDAVLDQKHIKVEFLKSKEVYTGIVKKNSQVDVLFNNIMKYEVEKLWKDGKEKK